MAEPGTNPRRLHHETAPQNVGPESRAMRAWRETLLEPAQVEQRHTFLRDAHTRIELIRSMVAFVPAEFGNFWSDRLRDLEELEALCAAQVDEDNGTLASADFLHSEAERIYTSIDQLASKSPDDVQLEDA